LVSKSKFMNDNIWKTMILAHRTIIYDALRSKMSDNLICEVGLKFELDFALIWRIVQDRLKEQMNHGLYS
jgi:hypothetical protein